MLKFIETKVEVSEGSEAAFMKQPGMYDGWTAEEIRKSDELLASIEL